MATRNLQFFGTRAETLVLVADIARRLGAHPVLYRGRPKPELRAASVENLIQQADAFEATRIFLSPEPAGLTTDPEKIVVARLHWLMVYLPQREGNQLLMAGLAAKSDWFDADTYEVHQAPEVLKLFKRAAAAFKQALMFPVWAWNRNHGPSVAYKQIGYLPGARQFLEAGGEWMQDLGGNTMFALELPPDRVRTA